MDLLGAQPNLNRTFYLRISKNLLENEIVLLLPY